MCIHIHPQIHENITCGWALMPLHSKLYNTSPERSVARDSATYPCPYSNIPLNDTSRYGIVIPWDLWMERAHASMRGNCWRDANTLRRGREKGQKRDNIMNMLKIKFNNIKEKKRVYKIISIMRSYWRDANTLRSG